MRIHRKRALQGVMFIGLLMLAATVKQASSATLPEGWLHAWPEAAARAKAEKKGIVGVFSADWCPPCQQMIKEVYPLAEVKAELSKWVPVYLDGDKLPDVMQANKVEAFPTFILFSPEGKEEHRFVGGRSAEEFLSTLKGHRELPEIKSKLEKAPEDPALWKQLADLRLAREEQDEAIAAYEKVAYLDPKDELGTADDLYLLKAMPKTPEDLPAAAEKFAAFEAKFPKSDQLAKATFFHALIEADSDHREKALEILEKNLPRFAESEYADRMKRVIAMLKETN